MSDKPALPPSASSNSAALLGLACSALAVLALTRFGIGDPVWALVILCLAYFVPIALYDLVVAKVHRNPSAGLDWDGPWRPDVNRIIIKLVALAAVLAAVIAFHALFRMFELPFALLNLQLVLEVLPWAVPLSIVYIAFVDGRMRDPQDGYWHFGAFILGRNPSPDLQKLKQFALGWIIKGYFLPIMAGSLLVRLKTMQELIDGLDAGGVQAVVAVTGFFIVLDLIIGTVGYVMTCRLFDAHIRTSNPYMFGWVVTLVCYPPFNFVVLNQMFKYTTERDWSEVIEGYPGLVVIWCALVLATYFTWLWATANFGIRFSNLTHRGIITGGPYRFTKHPDYFSKSCFFWLTAAPFLTAITMWEAIAASAALVVTNAIYYGRAIWEEKHLSEDPVYVDYALAMNEHSIFRPVARLLPFLVYRAPDGRTCLAQDPDAPVAQPAE